MEKNLYAILGVDPKSSIEEITKAYRALAKQYHPDRNAGDSEAQAKYAEVDEAYAILSDPIRRRVYDETGATRRSAESVEARVVRRLVPMVLTEIIDHGRDPKHTDILQIVKGKLQASVQELKRSLKDAQNKADRVQLAFGRITTPEEGQNPFEEGMQRVFKDIQAHKSRVAGELEEFEAAIKYIETCAYRTDVFGAPSTTSAQNIPDMLKRISLTWGD